MGASLPECRLWSTPLRPPDVGRLICYLLCISQSKSIWNHSQIGSDRWWSSQADWSACSQKSGCPMKLTPPALKHHRTPWFRGSLRRNLLCSDQGGLFCPASDSYFGLGWWNAEKPYTQILKTISRRIIYCFYIHCVNLHIFLKFSSYFYCSAR